jgi:multidrug efflux pump
MLPAITGSVVNFFAPFIRRPIGTSLLAAGLTLAGAIAYMLLGVAALPSIEVPAVFIQTQMPGANAQTMASTIIAPLERHLGQIPGVDQMYSNSTEGAGFVRVRFTMDRSTDAAARDVQAAINAAAADLPAGMPTPPQYFKFDTGQIPVLLVAFTSKTMPPDKLFDVVNTLIMPNVKQIDGVSRVQVFGGTPHAVRIELDTNALAAKQLTANDVSNALNAANVNSPQGVLSDGATQMTVTANDGLREPADFANILIAVRNNVPVRLSDIAKVSSGEQDQYQAAWFQGDRSVTMQISKRPEANSIATAEAIRAALPRFQSSLPADAVVTPIFDLTQTTQSALHEVKVALLISIVMVVLVMMVFLRRLGPTMIATLSVPLSLAGAFVVMWILGYTLNTMSLMALVLCIGFVVDDAIVVIENIVRHMENGSDPMPASLDGVREIGFTVVSITLSLIAVFAPLLFGNNMITKLLREFSVTLAAAVLISAVVSLTLTPALCARYLKHDEPDRKVSRWERALERFDRGLLGVYQRGLDWALRHRRIMRWQPLILLIATVGLGIAVVKTAGGNFMPDEDTGMLQAEVTADANISPDEMSRRLKRVGEMMQNDPTVADVSTILGSGNDGAAVGNSGLMFIDLKPKGSGPGQRKESIKEIMERLGKDYEKLSDIQVFMSPVQFLGGGGNNGNRGQYSFQLISTGGENLQPWVMKLVRKMRTVQGFKDVGSDFDVVGKQQMLQVDRDAAGRLSVGMGMVDSALYNAFGQRQVSIIYSDINQYWVVLTAAAAQTLSPDALLNTYVKSGTGVMVPLSAMAKIAPVATPTSVTHQNQLESADITYNLTQKISADKGNTMVEEAVRQLNLPEGIRMDFTGANQRLKDAQSNGMVLLIGAILAVYIVLGILYESLGHPLTIISTLPAAGAGAFLAMLVTQTQLTLMAIIAVLLLIGIVKKNAILMVDFALVAQREHGMSPVEAIRQAALVRFRPITMTTLVAMGAALPLAIGFGVGSEMRRPLGIAIVGGLLVSQLLTLLSTPAIYLWNHDRKIRVARRKHRRMLKYRYKIWLKIRKAREAGNPVLVDSLAQ